jgi:hypothetical protein
MRFVMDQIKGDTSPIILHQTFQVIRAKVIKL